MGRAIRAASVALFIALTAAAAQVSIPAAVHAGPLTLQPMVVLLGGAALGSTTRDGGRSPVYLLLGIAGLPVFAASRGAAARRASSAWTDRRLPLSYPFAAFVAGWLAERGLDRRYITSVFAMACGLAVIFCPEWRGWRFSRIRPWASTLPFARLLSVHSARRFQVVCGRDLMPTLWRVIGRSH